MKKTEKDELMKEIVIERIKTMSPNVKIALGSQGTFLTKKDILKEIKKQSEIGKTVIKIHTRYLKAFKEGIINV